MERISALLTLCAMFASPSTVFTQILFTVMLDGSQVVPPVTSSGHGKAWAVLSEDMKTPIYRVTFAQLNAPGYYVVQCDGSHLSSGIYICRLEVGGIERESREMVLAR
jgi:hypothetical protein